MVKQHCIAKERTLNEEPVRISDVFGQCAPDASYGKQLECSDGAIIANGVYLPAMVAVQLKALGRPLTSYSPGELRDAIMATFADGRVIDDPAGDNFTDKLSMTDEERCEQNLIPGMVTISPSALFRAIKAHKLDEDPLYSWLTEPKFSSERASS